MAISDIIKIIVALERPDREAALAELTQEFSPEEVVEAVRQATEATVTVNGQKVPNGRLRFRGIVAIMSFLDPNAPRPNC